MEQHGNVGPLAAPGSYTATLYSTTNGKARELASAVSFEVKPLAQGTVPGGVSPEQRSAMVVQVEDLRRNVSMASSQINDLKSQLKSFRVALDRSTAVASDLEATYEQLRQAVFAAEETIMGKRSRNGMGTSPATIGSRLFMLEFVRANTWGLTDTQQQQMVYVQDALNTLLPQINNLMDSEFPSFKRSLLEAGAPWVPMGMMKETGNQPVEID